MSLINDSVVLYCIISRFKPCILCLKVVVNSFQVGTLAVTLMHHIKIKKHALKYLTSYCVDGVGLLA